MKIHFSSRTVYPHLEQAMHVASMAEGPATDIRLKKKVRGDYEYDESVGTVVDNKDLPHFDVYRALRQQAEVKVGAEGSEAAAIDQLFTRLPDNQLNALVKCISKLMNQKAGDESH